MSKTIHTLLTIFITILSLSISIVYAGDKKVPFGSNDSLDEIRIKIKINGYNFKVGPTSIYKMQRTQKKFYYGRHPSTKPRDVSDSTGMGPLLYQLRKRTTLPVNFDWRNVNGKAYIGPVRNQGGCGSCYSFGAAAAAEGTYNWANGLSDDNLIDFSEAYIAFCLSKIPPYSDHFDGCQGADYEYYELQALTEKGIILEKDFPYQEDENTPCKENGETTKFKSWHRIGCTDVEAIKTAINTFGVVDASVMVNSAFEAYESGIYEDTETSCDAEPCYNAETNHAIALVGWGEENGKGYWILRNSWGKEWGENGYMRISHHAAHVSCAVAYLVFENPKTPIVKTEDATDVMENSATLHASVNTNNDNTSYYFEYGKTTKYGQTSTTTPLSASVDTISVSFSIHDLDPITTYHYRIVATNSFGSSFGVNKTISTSGTPLIPVVKTKSATDITSKSAILHAIVNPKGGETTCYFEYGKDESYGLITANPQKINGTLDIPIQLSAYKLDADTLYHYRIIAENESGITYGDDNSFSTTKTIDQLIFDGSFEGSQWTDEGAHNTFWKQTSDYWLPIWNDPEIAHSGDWFAWFDVTASIDQSVSLPESDTLVLSFWFKTHSMEYEEDFTNQFKRKKTLQDFSSFRVKIGNIVVYEFPNESMKDYSVWQEENINLSSFANGETQKIIFEAEVDVNEDETYTTRSIKNLETLTFIVDDISIKTGDINNEPPEKHRFDLNEDGNVNLGDLIYFINYFSNSEM